MKSLFSGSFWLINFKIIPSSTYSALWKYSTLWIFSMYFVYIITKDWSFLSKFWTSDPSVNRNIFRSLYLEFKTSTHVQIAITHYYVLFTNIWIRNRDDMNLRFTLGKHFGKWSGSMILSTWSRDFLQKCILVCKFFIVLLPTMLIPNVNFIAGVKVDISS